MGWQQPVFGLRVLKQSCGYPKGRDNRNISTLLGRVLSIFRVNPEGFREALTTRKHRLPPHGLFNP